MAHGGARNRSGPMADPNSARSDSRGFKLSALPSEGFSGVVPEIPLPGASERELEVWAEAWSTPQACVWSLAQWRWPIIAEYCRLKVIVEQDASATAALVSQLHRYRDQLGLTPAGLRDNGWAIAADEVATKSQDCEQGAPTRSSSRDRLKVVNSDA